jgi:hypothetical protein
MSKPHCTSRAQPMFMLYVFDIDPQKIKIELTKENDFIIFLHYASYVV